MIVKSFNICSPNQKIVPAPTLTIANCSPLTALHTKHSWASASVNPLSAFSTSAMRSGVGAMGIVVSTLDAKCANIPLACYTDKNNNDRQWVCFSGFYVQCLKQSRTYRPHLKIWTYEWSGTVKEKGKGSVQLLMEFHLTATECHLLYGITQCYLPPDTSEHTPP